MTDKAKYEKVPETRLGADAMELWLDADDYADHDFGGWNWGEQAYDLEKEAIAPIVRKMESLVDDVEKRLVDRARNLAREGARVVAGQINGTLRVYWYPERGIIEISACEDEIMLGTYLLEAPADEVADYDRGEVPEEDRGYYVPRVVVKEKAP
jgi:hypothetical protein